MSVVPSSRTAESGARREAARALGDRLLLAAPLLGVYIVLCGVYVVEVWKRVTPWLFGDELELTQVSRSIADQGRPAQRGVPTSWHSLYTVLTAPVWLIQHVPTAYAGVKYLDVFVMASAVVPTYFLARMLVGRKAALFAAAGAGAIPALAYTGYIVEENLAYPYATLCFFLIAKALAETRQGQLGWAVAAIVASAIAPAVRGELTVVPVAAFAALVFAWWTSDAARAWRRSWRLDDHLGTITLVLGAIFAISAIGSEHSQEWLVATRGFKHRMINMVDWAAGSLAIGIGVIPLAAGLAALVRPRGEPRTPELRAFRSVTLAALIAFGLYTAIKAAYLSTVFATRIEERNLVYVAPLLFVGTALLLERRRVNPFVLLATASFATYLVVYALYHPTQGPYEMQFQLYSDALGLAILQQANRYLYWTPETARWVLLGVSLGGTLAVAAMLGLRSRARLSGALAVLLGLGLVGWTLTGEVAAAVGSDSISRAFGKTLSPRGQPFSWVDEVTGGRPTLYVGEGEADPNAENMLEFWNRSITRVGSFDGTVGGPGPSGAPNLARDGTTYWTDTPAHPGSIYDYVVEDYPCVDFAGSLAATHAYRAGGQIKVWRLIRLTHPNRLQAMCTGIYPDGWTGLHDSAYFRFSGSPHGWLRIVVSRRDWGGPTGPSPVHVLVGKLVIDQYADPILGTVEHEQDLTIDSTQTKVVWVKAPSPRFAVHVVVDKKFVPNDYNHLGDTRQLGAEVSYRYFKTLPQAAKLKLEQQQR